MGRNRGDARQDGDHEPRALGRQHVPARQFRSDDRGAPEPGDIRRVFQYLDLGARGQAWALYGFVQAYQTSDNPAFLKTAEAVANYFVGHLPANDIPPWDFGAPTSPTRPVDTSAAAIAAGSLVMLSSVAGTSALKTLYLHDVDSILGSLSSSYLGPASGASVLFDGYPGRNGTNTALIYGDYYFTEALLRLQDVLDGHPGWLMYSPVVHSSWVDSPVVHSSWVDSPVVPEPSTWAMMIVGFAGLGFVA